MIRAWTARRWAVTVVAAAATVLLVGVPTALIPTGVFGRGVPAPAWAWPVLLATAVLTGLLTATYVRQPGTPDAQERPARRGGVLGGVLTYLAVGCPTCNKLALLALGTTGAVRWFAPVQPLLAVGGLALLGYALQRRLAGERACPVAVAPAPVTPAAPSRPTTPTEGSSW